MNALWMILSALSFAGMGVFVKLGAGQFTGMELLFYRCSIGSVLLLVIMKHRGQRFQPTRLGRHFVRSLAGFSAMVLFFHALTVLPLATATTLNYTSSLFLALLSFVWLKERAKFIQVVFLCTGFAGVIILMGPSFHRGQMLEALMGLGSGFLAGVAIMNVRDLGRQGEPVWNIVLFFFLFSTVMSGIWTFTHDMHPVNIHNFWIVGGVGVCAMTGQLLMTKAYQGGHAIVNGALSYGALVFSSFFGVMIWDETLSLQAWAGIVILIASGVAMILLSRKPDTPASAN